MKIAMFHLDLGCGPKEANMEILLRATTLAAEKEANWIITPEIALQGYFFAEKNDEPEILPQPEPFLAPLIELIVKHKITFFLGCAERDVDTGKLYNSCLVIGPNGKIVGRHRKTVSHKKGAEAWLTEGDKLEPVVCPEAKVGILICADSWFVEKAKVLKQKGAEIIVVPAAWPPSEECGPGDCWERCSAATDLPVWVCNQTGKNGTLDFSKAQSAVVEKGKTLFTHNGIEPAILFFEWDLHNNSILSKQFEVMPLE